MKQMWCQGRRATQQHHQTQDQGLVKSWNKHPQLKNYKVESSQIDCLLLLLNILILLTTGHQTGPKWKLTFILLTAKGDFMWISNNEEQKVTLPIMKPCYPDLISWQFLSQGMPCTVKPLRGILSWICYKETVLYSEMEVTAMYSSLLL